MLYTYICCDQNGYSNIPCHFITSFCQSSAEHGGGVYLQSTPMLNSVMAKKSGKATYP